MGDLYMNVIKHNKSKGVEMDDDFTLSTPRPLQDDGIRVAGTLRSPKCHDVKDFLSRNRIPFKWLDIEHDPEARAMVESETKVNGRLPVVFFPDGDILVAPEKRTLAEKVGLQTQASRLSYDLIIIGAGPAGLGAAVQGASEGLRTLIIEREATGGQAGTSSRIENYLGFPSGLSGVDLAERATAQAKRLGVEILTAQEVINVRAEDPYHIVTLGDETELSCKALIIATGVKVRELDIPGIQAVTGAGVYYGAALVEAVHYKGEHVHVVGGANSAGQGALFFSRYASKVTILARCSNLKKEMSQYLIDQINSTPNIEVKTNTELVGVKGTDRLEAIRIKDELSGEECFVQTPAITIFIGAAAHTEFLNGVVERDRSGFIVTASDLIQDRKTSRNWHLKRDPYLLETSTPGIFVVGDVRQGAVRRVASAVGDGAVVVSSVHQYLKTV
jgi:thioredoxin reductase (NADPH)